MKRLIVTFLCAGVLAAGPSAAQVDVSSFGARGDGQTDDTSALQRAINSISVGGTLTFGGPNQVYLITSRLVIQPNRSYRGQGTIRMKSTAVAHTAIAKLAYNAADNVTISGITFDANGVGGGLQISVDGGTTVPANGLQLTHMIFRNTTATPNGPWDGAIYAPVGLTNSQITNNQVVNCAYGMSLTNLNAVSVSGNVFQQVHTGDAIQVVFNPAPFTYGQGIQINENMGQHLGRMGIEVWPTGGNGAQTSLIRAIMISGNTFSDWDAGYNPDTFGISIMAGQQNSVINNKLMGGAAGYGIEVGAPQSTISQNSVSGFATGIVLHDSSNSTVSGNLLTAQNNDGIEFSNAPGARNNMVVQGNSIINAKTFGILANTSSWGGTTLGSNFISRTAGFFSSDQSETFTGIAVTPPATPVTVTANSITQPGMTAPNGFSFMGIRLNGGSGANTGSTYQNNSILSQTAIAQSVGLFGNSVGSMNGTVIQGNSFTGLTAASGGAASSGALSSGNLVYNCVSIGPIDLMP